MTMPSDDAYLDGFICGLEFVLLGMEGRGLTGREADAFRRDYQRIVELYRSKRPAAVPAKAMAALMRN